MSSEALSELYFRLGQCCGLLARCTEAELAELATWAAQAFAQDERWHAVVVAAIDAELARRAG